MRLATIITVFSCAYPMVGATSFVAYAQNAAGQRYDAEEAFWSTPGDGRLVLLIRNAKDERVAQEPTFITPIPYRVRVCVTNVAGTPNNVNLFVWTTDSFSPNGKAPAAQPQVIHPGLGECVEIDRPSAIVAQDSTTSGAVSGYYQLLQQIDPKPIPVVRGARSRNRIEIGEPMKLDLDCKPLQNPSTDFARFCELEISRVSKAKKDGVRICTEGDFVSYQGEPKPRSYPPQFVELTTIGLKDSSIPPTSQYDSNWSPMNSQSCRDVIWKSDSTNVHPGEPASLFFMIGPAMPAPPWDGKKVEKMTVHVQAIGSELDHAQPVIDPHAIHYGDQVVVYREGRNECLAFNTGAPMGAAVLPCNSDGRNKVDNSIQDDAFSLNRHNRPNK